MVKANLLFKSKISDIPKNPGVYIFKDKSGGIIYIGKAKSLRARVRQYFAGDDGRPQIPYLLKELVDLDYTVVKNELESLYLERTLIQKHRPKYNIELKDDKNYVFIKIDYSTEIPQITTSRRIENWKLEIGNSFFGPYTSAKKVRDLIFTIRKAFGLCAAQKIGKPCFYYHLHRCPGVCAREMRPADYQKHLEKIKLFLKGQTSVLAKDLQKQMARAAGQKQFEKAGRLRDELRALEITRSRQNVILVKPVNWDLVSLWQSDGYSCVNLFKIRSGKLFDKENFVYENPSTEIQKNNGPTEAYRIEILQKFLEQYYLDTSDIPKNIYLQNATEDTKLIETIVKNRFQQRVKISIPQKGKIKQLIDLGVTNAAEYLKNYLAQSGKHLDKINEALNQLKQILGLSQIPKRIEGFDVSNIQGTNAVGSMVVFKDGLPAKSEYRKFKIRGKSTPDDFFMMKEMLGRRLARSANDAKLQIPNNKLQTNSKSKISNLKSAIWPLPDLMVIDGGKGQLSAALYALRKLQIPNNKLQIIGLAKRIEEIFLPGKSEPIILSHDQPALQLLQRLRDEAHRFGITFHRKLRGRQAVKSALDEIPGVGRKTKKLLKQKFGTVANIRNQSSAELSKVVGKKLAQIIKQNL